MVDYGVEQYKFDLCISRGNHVVLDRLLGKAMPSQDYRRMEVILNNLWTNNRMTISTRTGEVFRELFGEDVFPNDMGAYCIADGNGAFIPLPPEKRLRGNREAARRLTGNYGIFEVLLKYSALNAERRDTPRAA